MNNFRLLCIALLMLVVDTPHTQTARADTQPDRRPEPLSQLLDAATEYSQLQTIIIAQRGRILDERAYRGHSVTAPTNIKSASKASSRP